MSGALIRCTYLRRIAQAEARARFLEDRLRGLLAFEIGDLFKLYIYNSLKNGPRPSIIGDAAATRREEHPHV
jgi:hypothetical protein